MPMDALHMLKREESVALVIDVQEKLMPVIASSAEVTRNTANLVHGLRILNVPLFVTEQYPKGLGPTVAPVKEAAQGAPVIQKREFGSFANADFRAAMDPYANKTLIVCGVEAHVCVLQTSLQARSRGHRVFVVADAVGSRNPENKQMALDRLREADCTLVTTEMALFELLGTSEAPEFKAIQSLIR